MNITTSTEIIKYARINPTQYCYLFCMFHKEPVQFNILKQELDELEIEGYIYLSENNQCVLRDKALILFGGNGGLTKLFTEFWNAYPFKVPNGTGGYRVLRSQDIDTKQALDVKKKYNTVIKTKEQHEYMMNGLRGYLKQQRNSMQYVVGVEVFLNKKLWERYVDITENADKFSDDI